MTCTRNYAGHSPPSLAKRTIIPMGGDIKANPWVIVRAHYSTYIDARTDKVRWQDWALFTIIPLAVLAGCLAGGAKLNSGASSGLIAVSGLLSVFLFGVVTQVSERAMDFADSEPMPSRETTEHATALEQLAANAGYASLTCIIDAIVFVVASIGSGWILRISTAVGLALGAHMILVLFMVMRREFLLTQSRLNRAQTGADRAGRSIGRAS